MSASVITYSGVSAGAYTWVPLDYETNGAPFSASYSVEKVGTGDVSYSVQYTLADVVGGTDASAGTAFDVVSAKTASFSGSVQFPVAAVRVNVASVSGAVDLVFRTIQAG